MKKPFLEGWSFARANSFMVTAAKLSLPFRYKATVNEDQKIFRPLKDMNPTLCNASLFITPSSFRNNFKS